MSGHERRGAVTVLRLNRPEARNSLNPELLTAIGLAMLAAENDPETRAVVLTGTGDKAFCAGMDLRAFAEGGSDASSGNPEGMRGFVRFTQGEIGVPIVGAANATAVAGGFELLLGCDVVVASEAAKFGLPEVKRGLFAAGGGVFISTRIPLAVALELTLTGDLVDAERALSLGLINQVVPPEEVLDAAVALAERIARNGPLALQATKQLVRTASTDLEKARALAVGVAAEGVRQRGRQGGRDRVHREARPGLEGSLSGTSPARGQEEAGAGGGASTAASCVGRCFGLERHRDPGDDDVAAVPQRRREDDVDLVVQDPVAQLLRPYHRDEDDDLIVGVVRPHVVDEPDDRLDDRGVLVVQHAERHSRVPLPPLVRRARLRRGRPGPRPLGRRSRR